MPTASSSMSCQVLLTNLNIATMTDNGSPYGQIGNACVAVDNGSIVYVGNRANCPYHSETTLDGQGKWLIPGLIDCHTHLVFGGNRAAEFELRLNGATYEEIAKAGGGIKNTVKATREASFDELLASAKKRATRLVEEGVTTIEIKSGYGLDKDTEIKMLKVARALEATLPVTVQTTYLGAHTVPVEYEGDADGYVDWLCQQMLPKVKDSGLADAVDVFCESIGFSPAQCERIFHAAQNLALPIKAHVEQLSDLKGARLASRFNALSVDHLEYLDNKDIGALKAAGTVAVLLPGAFYFLNESRRPPVDALRAQGVPMAVATDLNPGSSPLGSLLSAMNMSSILFGLTPEEALMGTTVNAAKALGLAQKGQIQVGMDADFCLWDISSPAELVYGINLVRPVSKWVGGKHV